MASRLRASGQDVATAADVVSLVRSGHQEALQGVRAAGRELGRGLAGVVNLLDPGMVTLGGEFADIQDFLAGVREEVYRRALPLAGGHLEIVRASLGEDATLKGAACLVADELLSPRPVLSTLPGSYPHAGVFSFDSPSPRGGKARRLLMAAGRRRLVRDGLGLLTFPWVP